MSISCLYPVRFTSQCFHGCIHVCRDRSHRIVNPDFNANNGNGWSGTFFTAASAGVAEFWNETFDKYQDLADMPAGKYRLEVQGFCRYCYQAESRAAHDTGTEQLLASYYMNTAENPFMSLYDTTLLGVPDNVGQSNTAFNVNGDWCCFDNFRLYYKGAQSGVENVTVNRPDGPVNVYTVAGVLIREAVYPAEATAGLAPRHLHCQQPPSPHPLIPPTIKTSGAPHRPPRSFALCASYH